MKILCISGSLRGDSYNTSLLRTAAELAAPDADLELWEELKGIPPYDEDDDGDPQPDPVVRMKAVVLACDAVLFATPEYNSSIPGQLKNAIDWMSRPLMTNPLRNKPVGVIGASTGGFGAVWAQADLRKVLGALGARVIEAQLAVGHAATKIDGGRLVDESAREGLEGVVAALLAEVRERQAALAGAAA